MVVRRCTICTLCLPIEYYSSCYRYDIPFTRTRLCYLRDYFVRALCVALDSDALTQFIFATKRMSEANNELKTDFDMRSSCMWIVELMSKSMRIGHSDMASKVILIIVIYVKYIYYTALRAEAELLYFVIIML